MEQKDRTLSSIIILLTLGLMFYALSISGTSNALEGKTVKDIMIYLIDNYLDLILMS